MPQRLTALPALQWMKSLCVCACVFDELTRARAPTHSFTHTHCDVHTTYSDVRARVVSLLDDNANERTISFLFFPSLSINTEVKIQFLIQLSRIFDCIIIICLHVQKKATEIYIYVCVSVNIGRTLKETTEQHDFLILYGMKSAHAFAFLNALINCSMK